VKPAIFGLHNRLDGVEVVVSERGHPDVMSRNRRRIPAAAKIDGVPTIRASFPGDGWGDNRLAAIVQ
jgi:hypothetical protein